MDQKILRKVLQIGGMTCTSCEMRIENKLRKLQGVSDVKAIYSSSNVYVTYDANLIALEMIIEEIEKLDYTVKNKGGSQQSGKVHENEKSHGIFGRNRNDDSGQKDGRGSDGKMPINQLLGIGIIIAALYLIIKNTIGFNFIPQVNQNMGYGILFVVGLITSLHCVAMCGGINLSQCVSYKQDTGDTGKLAKVKPSLLYNTGRVISYTVLGGIVGALGSVVSFSGTAKGIIAILSGVFMVIMGLNMLFSPPGQMHSSISCKILVRGISSFIKLNIKLGLYSTNLFTLLYPSFGYLAFTTLLSFSYIVLNTFAPTFVL
jgi:copper chaperone CopZ/ribosomal protein S28E/S33